MAIGRADPTFTNTGLIATVAGILGLFTAANTLLSSVTSTVAQRRATFSAAVAAEEKRYADFYSEYFAALNMKDNPEGQTKELIAIGNLAHRDIPDFHEYPIGISLWGHDFIDPPGDARTVASSRIKKMRDDLVQAINDPKSSTKDAATTVDNDVNSAPQTRKGNEVTAAQQAITAQQVSSANIGLDYKTHVLAAGVRNGWDIDVFYCVGTHEIANFADALKGAAFLADLSTRKQAVGPGMPLGRIRIRPLAVVNQEPYAPQPNTRNYVVWDNGLGERVLADKLQELFEADLQLKLGVMPNGLGNSKWYMGVFMCDAHSAS